MGLIASIIAKDKAAIEATRGTCTTCKNLITISDSTFGCTTRDRLVMPQLLPYAPGKTKCLDWVQDREDSNERT